MGATIAALVSRAEFEARTAAGERLEYDEGQVIEMGMNDSQYEGIKGDLTAELILQLPQSFETIAEAAYEITDDKVRQPDISVCLSRRPRTAGRKRQGSPELAIEIVSPSDIAADLERKIRLLLAHGAKAVWVIYPEAPHMAVHQAGQPTRYYELGDTISGEEPIPQFTLPLARLFE
jgi:Uma2 family endonuclease